MIAADSGHAKAVRSPNIPSKNTTILPFPTGNLRQDYILKDDELGRGQFGVVRSCIHRRSGALLACKTIMKDVLQVSFGQTLFPPSPVARVVEERLDLAWG